ncbi:MAG TPA: cobalamin biosynthesis protein [Roseiarcus sp.]|nr:cobalamin biosynthesis protein [Roseiarcus sp.]
MIAIGIGCRRGASQAAIAAMIEQTLALTRTLNESVRLFSIEAKSGEAGLVDAAQAMNLPLEFLPAASLREVEDKIANPSRHAAAAFGVASVSEAAALAGAGPGARLIAPRMVGNGVACAVAQGSGR